MGSRVERMRELLGAAFAPEELEILDESARHAGHAARNGVAGGETHYRLTMVAKNFAGQSRLARQRAVNAVLAPEFAAGLHALSLSLKSPEE